MFVLRASLYSTAAPRRIALTGGWKTGHIMVKSDIYSFREADYPLLVSIPHNGLAIPEEISATMTEVGKSSRDTDWFLDRLYDFDVTNDVGMIASHYSRYVIDLNRDANAPSNQSLYPGQNTTGLFPKITFDQRPVYQAGKEPDTDERRRRIEKFWHPYHDQLKSELKRMRAKFGIAILFEAHSIESELPYLFEGVLPDLNFGTNSGKSCSVGMTDVIKSTLPEAGYSHAFNGRFIGGFITRRYANPTDGIHSIQLELSQATYMDQLTKKWLPDKAAAVQPVLRSVILAIRRWIDEQRK